ncbi:MAG: hydroxyisourate hydrolase [Hyphomicrobiaceae bacterium]
MTTNAGYVTTHVLDTSLGKPASNLKIDVSRVENDGLHKLRVVITNADGRCDQPVIRDDEICVATYELLFHAGDYLDRIVGRTQTPRFLDRIPIRFTIGDPNQHYHVPLLLSPYGYSTYRGS